MPKTRTIVKAVLFLLASALLALVITFFLHRPSMKVLAQWKQTPDVPYDGRGPYYLSIVERDLDWSGFPFGLRRNHFLYVGRDSGKPSYGHMIQYSFHASHPDDPDNLEPFLRRSKVLWTPDGVTLDLPSGHRLFIPKSMFTGGR